MIRYFFNRKSKNLAYLCIEITLDMDEVIDTGKIASIQALNDQKLQLEQQIKELSAPILTDFNLVPKLHKLFLETFANHKEVNTVYYRKKFLWVILFLYFPETLAGIERLPLGIRPILAKCFNLNSKNTISDNLDGLMQLYNTYRDFRRHTSIFYERIMEFIANKD